MTQLICSPTTIIEIITIFIILFYMLYTSIFKSAYDTILCYSLWPGHVDMKPIGKGVNGDHTSTPFSNTVAFLGVMPPAFRLS